MKTKHIAPVALMACAGAAWAQSGVTLYGVVDTNLEYATNLQGPTPGSSGNRIAMQSGGLSGSRWGMRGVEDLGGGLSALFVLESGFASDTGQSQQSGRLFGRQAFVGLKSGTLGQLTLGRQYTTLFQLLANFEPMAYSTQYEPAAVQTGVNFRSDNTAMYTGTFGPVTAQAHWSFGTGAPSASPTGGGNGEVPGQARRDSGYGAGVAYSAGPLGATLAYDQYNPSTPLGGGAFSSGTVRKAAVAGSYLIGDTVKVMGGYRWGQNKNAVGSVALRDDYYWAGVNYQASSAVMLSLEYSYQKITTINSAPSTQANPWQVAFIADYSLSKRTDLYLTTAYARNAGLALDQAGVDLNATGYSLASGKTSMVGAALGIRHKF
ncbi:Outer membrane porin protein [Ralstonia condita]|uniref:Outer membrane porin protein n=1 Tax=Ralstonia condita TaxID=3058600 RepID=A0ABN9ITX1_9RALS|nr:porin [Ralstonia sp. LMG 7141]CAJ0790342.1 Outer membrane porin protein [Ralstonia sp. LMG 7141]